MAEKEEKELDPLVTMPHGREQLIKMEILIPKLFLQLKNWVR